MDTLFDADELANTESAPTTIKRRGRTRYGEYAPYKQAERLQMPMVLGSNSQDVLNTRFGRAMVITSERQLVDWLAKGDGPIALDLETYPVYVEQTGKVGSALDVHTCGISITSLARGIDDIAVCLHIDTPLTPELTFHYLKGKTLVMFNAGFDAAIMARVIGIRELFRSGGAIHDTQIMFGMDTAGLRPSHEKELSLNNMSIRYLNIELAKSVRTKYLDKAVVNEEFLIYAAEDSAATIMCYYELYRRLQEKELLDLFLNLESKVLPVIIMMSLRGVDLDHEKLNYIKDQIHLREQALAAELVAMEPELGTPSSNREVLRVLHMRDIKVPNTDKRTLAKYRNDPFVAKFMEWRKMRTLFSSQFRPWVEKANQSITGRLHPSFTLTHTDTGRLSSRSPNSQNISKEKGEGELNFIDVRACFVAPDGYQLVTADYSQYELRILAEISCDQNMRREFHEEYELLQQYEARLNDLGILPWHHEEIQRASESDHILIELTDQLKLADKHRRTASMLFGKDPREVSTKERAQAKAVSFGVVYGMGPGTLAETLSNSLGTKVDIEEAKELLEAFFRSYPGVKAYIHDCERQVEGVGYTRTMMGRKRFFYQYLFIHSEHSRAQRMADYRAAVNAPIQGTNADVIKLALIYLDEHLFDQYPDRYPVLTVHDELVVVTPASQVDDTAGLVRDCMLKASYTVLKHTPTVVSVAVGRHWQK